MHSCLFIAVQKLNVLTVEKLIEKGADVNKRDLKTGDRPIHTLISAYSKNLMNAKRILEILVSAGANLSLKNNEYNSALHIAVKRGCYDAVESLIELSSSLTKDKQVDINS